MVIELQAYIPGEDFVDLSLEGGLLTALSTNPEAFWEVADLLPEPAFSDPANKLAYSRLARVASGETIPARLLKTDREPVADVVAAAQQLSELYQKRQLAQLNAAIATRLYKEKAAVSELIAAFETGLTRIQSEHSSLAAGVLLSAGDLLSPWREMIGEKIHLNAENKTGITGISTGWGHIDNLLNGLAGSSLYVLGGSPKVGKTTFVNQLAFQVARQWPVLYVTFENDPLDLIDKNICRLADVSLADTQKGKVALAALEPGIQRFAEAAARLYYLRGDPATTIARIQAKARQAMQRHGSKRCVIILDYLQKMAVNMNQLQMRDNVSRLTMGLRTMAQDLASPVIAIASLNRAAYSNGEQKPNSSSWKESGNIEYDVDMAVFLTRNNERPVPAGFVSVDFTIDLNRHGPQDMTVHLLSRPDRGQFVEEAPAMRR